MDIIWTPARYLWGIGWIMLNIIWTLATYLWACIMWSIKEGVIAETISLVVFIGFFFTPIFTALDFHGCICAMRDHADDGCHFWWTTYLLDELSITVRTAYRVNICPRCNH